MTYLECLRVESREEGKKLLEYKSRRPKSTFGKICRTKKAEEQIAGAKYVVM